MMSSQEIETAMREKIPIVILIWEDGAYGLIKVEDGARIGPLISHEFHTSRFRQITPRVLREGLSRHGCRSTSAGAAGSIGFPIRSRVITCPVDYSENTKLTTALADLAERA